MFSYLSQSVKLSTWYKCKSITPPFQEFGRMNQMKS